MEGYFNRNELQNIVGVSSAAKCLNAALKKGTKMEDITLTCGLAIDDDYIIG